MSLSLNITPRHLSDYTLPWFSHRPTCCKLEWVQMFTPFFTKRTSQFSLRQSIDHTFRRAVLVSPMFLPCVLKSTPCEGLRFNIFPQKRVWSRCLPPTSNLVAPSASLLQHFLYAHALFKHTHSILHTGLLWVPPCSSANLHEGHSSDGAGVRVFFQPQSQRSLSLPEASVWLRPNYTHIFWFLKLCCFLLSFSIFKKLFFKNSIYIHNEIWSCLFLQLPMDPLVHLPSTLYLLLFYYYLKNNCILLLNEKNGVDSNKLKIVM